VKHNTSAQGAYPKYTEAEIIPLSGVIVDVDVVDKGHMVGPDNHRSHVR
jgi:hypothetical protein